MKKQIKYIKKTEFAEKLSELCKDIQSIKFEKGETHKTLHTKFYNVMRKYGITQGTWNGNARTCNNFEWTICYKFFLSCIHQHMEFTHIFRNHIPEDLLAYGKQPKTKLYGNKR